MKTISLKKVSAVAVASLGFGLLSVVPANAAVTPASDVTSINLALGTSSPTVNSVVEVNFGATTLLALSVGDTTPYVGVLTSFPSGGFVSVTARVLAAGSVAVTAKGASSAASGSTLTITGQAASTVTASSTVGAGSFNFTPTVAGDYVLSVWNDAANSGVIDILEARQTILIKVAAAAGYSAPLSTIFAGTGAAVATSVTDLVPIAISRTAGGGQAANIRVAIKNTSGAAYTGQTVTATVSGPGLLKCASVAAANTAEGNATGTLRSESVTDTTGFVTCRLDPDGTAGTSTMSISVTDKVSLATTVLGSKTVVFFGAVAKIVATPIFTIGTAGGGTTGDASTARTASTIIPAVIVKATDSGDRVIPGLTISALSSDLAVVNSAITIAGDTAGSAFSSGGAGFYNASFSTPSVAVSGKAATLTFRILDPSDLTGVAFLTSVVNITIGGGVATEVLSFDKASYAPGEAMVVTVTAKDSAGNPVADGTASPAITFSKAVGGTSPAVSVYTGGKKSTSATAPTVFAPVISGAFSALATSGNTAKSAITASSSVTDGNAAASAALNTRIDSLNAKIVALTALIAKIMKSLKIK